MDPTLASSVSTEQVEMCIKLGLLCTQGDPQLRPTMGRVVVILSKKPGHMEEPTRPGIPGSRYRRAPRRPFAMSSRTSTSGGDVDDSDSHTFDSSNYGTNTTATATTSSNATSEVDRRGKRPMKG